MNRQGTATNPQHQDPGAGEQQPEPQAIEEIPGLGPIRARALKKAGFNSLQSLREATVSQLCAVPGMTGIKAGQLIAYLRGETDRVATPPAQRTPRTKLAPAPPGTARPISKPNSPGRTSPQLAANAVVTVRPEIPPAPVVPADSPLIATARRVSLAASGLLRAESASSYNKPFARQVGKLAVIAERIVHETGGVQTERALSQLLKIEELLSEITSSDSIGGKRQDRFAEEMRDRRHKLTASIESAGPALAPTPNEPGSAVNRRSEKDEKRGKKDRRDR